MMSHRIQPEKLAIEHVGKPGERVPIRYIESCEGPSNTLQCQSSLNLGIECDVPIVVIVNKAISGCRVIERQRTGNEQQCQNGFLPTLRSPAIGNLRHGCWFGSALCEAAIHHRSSVALRSRWQRNSFLISKT